jgi:1,4-dihydroxy-2-naphthoate octaprenyltransferase
MEPRRFADRCQTGFANMSASLPAPRVWLLAMRPFSFTASVVPAVFGGLLALTLRGHAGVPAFAFDGTAFVVTIVGCLAIHAASNLINDFFDYRSGVDKAENFGRVNVLVRKTMSPAQVSLEAAAAFAVAVACGFYLVVHAGPAKWPLVALVVFGALSAYFYTAPPFALKNRGIGDVQVMLSFALLMVFGAFYVQAETITWLPFLGAIPIGLLVVDILHVNNLRDLPADRAAGITTVAIALGEDGAKRLHDAYVIAAYVATIALTATHVLPVWTLIVFAGVPRALALSRAVGAIRRPDVDPMIVVKTARFHALFGGLLIAGLLIALVVPR